MRVHKPRKQLLKVCQTRSPPLREPTGNQLSMRHGNCSAAISMFSNWRPPVAHNVAILVPSTTRARAWIPVLAEALRNKLGVEATIVTAGRARKEMPTVSERLERLALKSPKGFGRFVDVSTVTLESLSPRPALLIDTTGLYDSKTVGAPVLTPVLNGHRPEASIVSVLWNRQPPQLGVRLTTGQESKMLRAARIAVPDRDLTTRALDVIFRRLVALLTEATAHLLNGKPLPTLPDGIEEQRAPPAGSGLWKQAVNGYLPKAGRQFIKPFMRREDWCLGYRRRMEPARFPDKLDLRPETFTLLPSPPSRCYADPFLFEKDGKTFLFFEEHDYTTGKAHICFVTLGAGGASKPVVALKRPYHLSYPFIFEHEGRVLMIPETSGNRTIELYEATTFPQAWSLRSVLVPHIDAADATVCQKDGRWWMFATVVAHGGSSWDSVSIFWADMLEGPWHSHAMNPVKYDVTSARPAGALIEHEGRLRPVQDCSNGYGSALAWCEIVKLIEADFAERVVARQSCPAGSGYYGLHTYNRSTWFETVDFKRSRRR